MSKKENINFEEFLPKIYIGIFSFILFLFVLSFSITFIINFGERAEAREIKRLEDLPKVNSNTFIVYPGQIKSIETNGKYSTWNSDTLVGSGWQQNIDVIIYTNQGEPLTYLKVNGSILHKIPDWSLIEKVAFRVHENGLPEEVDFVISI